MLKIAPGGKPGNGGGGGGGWTGGGGGGGIVPPPVPGGTTDTTTDTGTTLTLDCWTPCEDLYEGMALAYHAATRIGDQAWLSGGQFGGYAQSSIWNWDLRTGEIPRSWNPMTYPRYRHGMAAIGDTLYIFGGASSQHAFLAYRPADQSFTVLAAATVPPLSDNSGVLMLTDGTDIYVTGEYIYPVLINGAYYSQLLRYRPSTNVCTTLTPLPFRRTGMMGCLLPDGPYAGQFLMGAGLDANDNSGQVGMLRGDIGADDISWHAAPDFPLPAQWGVMTVWRKRVFAGLGDSPSGRGWFELNLTDLTWTPRTSMHEFMPWATNNRIGAAAVAHDDFGIFVQGGFDGASAKGTTIRYLP